ncbi:putative 1-acyl-sn-glycerol-3-phosphate acyltransferase 2 protein [Lasiodiplodia theobromae]|uniref:Putative acyltransferase n=1 Tax=Lasiodiplodia theobromae TaxID=45133 RepID=A0A5N5CTC8_9PEZI|nr:1-acyl-sn-glycerol-3-phosphate acyltransferase [Lasiodiplodia theobromae]KAB2568599.1 putative acyltransferase [Lasiodiplodia theobromae]KAF4543468.1 1-acyl-sn-glycerol-3-phosphate acyltransferase [Lasiodiplodia theobromae]KAF9631201.1 putative 1-acyl-sn-glycerol-3-phosphate acyltransferase 2 protein [Lasiodiplodia theobromae]
MDADGLKHRPNAVTKPIPPEDLHEHGADAGKIVHPAGPVKHGGPKQALRMFLFGVYFMGSCVCINITQLIGAPIYFYSKDWYYAWMAVTKQHFGLLITTMTQWWSPTVVRVSGDESVRGQLRQTEDGRLECDFPDRLLLIANHQIYTDWLYLWWIAYTSRMHGHLYIILKESLKYIPIIGTGMQFFSFIFLSRKWATDKPRFQHRLQKLNARHKGPMSGEHDLDPMWLLIFPEGTNLSSNGRESSARWAKKSGQSDLRHALLPRSTGLFFCLQELKGTTEWVYDCTMAYEGIPRGLYGQDIFTLKSTYFEGRPPRSVNLHWRRFAVKDIPISSQPEFEEWILQRWREKDDLLEIYLQTGRFPADPEGIRYETAKGLNGMPMLDKSKTLAEGRGYIETEVRPKSPFEFLQIFIPGAALVLVGNVVAKTLKLVKSVASGA